jgi:hypothetical protein
MTRSIYASVRQKLDWPKFALNMKQPYKSKLPAVLFVLRSVKSDDKHVLSAVVDAKLVCMRSACMIAVIGTINSHKY